MPDRKLGLAWWRDAKTDPPERGARVLVDRPILAHAPVFAYRSGLDDKYKMWSDPHDTLDPQPSVWCDPSPPGDDAPTLKDLQRAHDALLYASGNLDHGILTVVYPEECEASAARIRRAIEEAER